MDIELIKEASNFYRICGYKEIAVPHIVDWDVLLHTKLDSQAKDFVHSRGKLYVASAEQSFIQMHKDGNIKNGRWQAITPCIRDEAVHNADYYLLFLKLELINIGEDDLDHCIKTAKEFFRRIVCPVDIIETDIGLDLISQDTGVELGSYGVRKMLDGTVYTYGTGIAEPRTSLVLSR